MAGGEFCGNATRCAIFQILGGQPGKTTLRVSGTDESVNGGINNKYETWAEMPIYKDPKRIKKVKDLFIVELQGITQIVTFINPGNNSPRDIKKRAKKILNDFNLLKTAPAAGVMFVAKEGNNFRLNPVVWVRKIKTFFYETACASGTTALGLVEALKMRNNCSLLVAQPSGQKITAEVSFRKQKFSKATISGKVELLKTCQII